jgi:hypothetical protein
MNSAKTPWPAVLGFASLFLLGLGVPFWMAYKSLANPPLPRRSSARRVAFDLGKKYYCPACGAELTLPAWSDPAPRPGGPLPALTLKSLTTSSFEVARTRRPQSEILGDAP